MFGSRKTSLFAVTILIFLAIPGYAAAMSVSLTPSIVSPAPVGTIVTWTPTVSGVGSATLWYRYRARPAGGTFHMVRDFGPDYLLDWTASDHEGTYEIELTARNLNTGDSAATTAQYVMTSRVGGNTPVISPTANPFVFQYSAPPCPVGGQIRVQFQSSIGIVYTPFQACQDGVSMNFYLAGMRPESTYWAQHTVETGSGFEYGPVLTLKTPSVSPSQIPSYSILQSPPVPLRSGVLLQATLTMTTVATDVYGNLVWFYPGRISYLTRPQAGGTFFGIFENFPEDQSAQIVREFDLVGTTIRETNAARINEQLASMGKRQIDAFHHEARGLPGGNVLVLASSEQLMTDIQGPGTVDVIGDVILVLDQDLQVLWTWDAFEHIDWYRKATLGEVCTQQAAGCPPYYLASQANDWLHGNSVQLTPDGNILYSARHQDWLIKIDYNNGAGTGKIIWRLGNGGDFQINSTDPNPWFSHQHDAEFAAGDNSTLMLFDNGDVRRSTDGNANSRGQVIHLDEQNHIASLVVNADLGGYSFALGSAQRLPNGNYHFHLGWLQPSNTSQAVEVDPSGKKVYTLEIGSPGYRSFRMRDLYTP
jgi:arylsulfate sulfotransferase